MADPPWSFRLWKNKKTRTADAYYSLLDDAEIGELFSTDTIAPGPLRDVRFADDAACFLWVVSSKLPEGIATLETWGFNYKTIAFSWLKTTKDGRPAFGMGSYTRQNVELCLLGTRGHPKRISKSVRQSILSPRREHSRKPDEQYALIEELFDGPYLELFARHKREGWDVWGLEAPDQADT